MTRNGITLRRPIEVGLPAVLGPPERPGIVRDFDGAQRVHELHQLGVEVGDPGVAAGVEAAGL